jgi:hypothetical protein
MEELQRTFQTSKLLMAEISMLSCPVKTPPLTSSEHITKRCTIQLLFEIIKDLHLIDMASRTHYSVSLSMSLSSSLSLSLSMSLSLFLSIPCTCPCPSPCPVSLSVVPVYGSVSIAVSVPASVIPAHR